MSEEENPNNNNPQDSAAEETVAATPDDLDSTQTDSTPPPPPASFEMLVSMLFSQAMTMLGQIPDPQSGEVTTNKPFAKYTIDTLEMLGEKTSGNLSDSESKMLSQTLHALRMAYIEVK